MADSIGSVVQGAHSGFYVYWAKHLGIDKEAFYLSARKNASSVELTDICLDTNTVVGYEEIGSRTGPSLNTVVKSTLLGGTGLGLLASSVSNNEEASFVVFLKDGESCTVHLDITWAVQYFRRIFVTKKGAGPNGSNMQQGGVARVSGDPKALLERAFMFLEDGDWAKADIYCESVLDQEPKCAEAYLGKLMVEVKVHKKEDLSKAKEPLDQTDNYSKVMRFADESLRESLSKAKELQHNEQRYTEAVACMAAASDEDAYRSASQKFLLLGSYKDSSSRREQCIQRADRIIADRRQREEIKRKEDIYSRAEKCMRLGTVEGCNSAIRLYESIPGYRSSAAQISECRRKIEEIKAKEAARQVAVEKAKKKAKKIAIIAAPIVCVCIAFVIVLTTVIIPKQEYNKKYNEALDLIDSGDYESAYALLEEIGKNDVIATNKYDRAIKLLDSGDYDLAYDLLNQIEKNDIIESSKYDRAVKCIDSGDYQAAYILLNGLEYKDSVEKLQNIRQTLLAKAAPGDTVYFGTYAGVNIEWLILTKKDNKLLLISEKGLAIKKYNDKFTTDVTWENCDLRNWSEVFSTTAFSTNEQMMIQPTSLDEGTTDKVFVLSVSEFNEYFSGKESSKCVPTVYAKSNGALDGIDDTNCWWWLRTPSGYKSRIACVNNFGSIEPRGAEMYSDSGISLGNGDGVIYERYKNICVRPAMWISVK